VGLFRKMTSMSTMRMVDFRSDKERIARNYKKLAKELKEQNKLLREANRLQQQRQRDQ
jgi:hypothetical protein